MNGFTEHQASGASEASGRRDVVLTWAVAQSMVPLVRQIVGDILKYAQYLARLRPEKDRLDRERVTLAWPQRQRRYQLTEEILKEEARLQAALAELDSLGVKLLDAEMGRVGFPTIVNNRRAYFSWRPSDESLDHWHFAESSHRRVVPASWKELGDQRRSGKRKPGRS